MDAATPTWRVGCDVVDVARLASKLARTPGLRERLFTPRELADACRGGLAPDAPAAVDRLAARFAAKEATRKALGDLRLPFHDSEVRSGPHGAPQLFVRGCRSGLSLSLSHDAGVAVAVVVGTRALTPLDAATTSPGLAPTRPFERGDQRASG